jgi:hypothetical protein
VRRAETQAAAGQGLSARYYDNKDLTAPKLTRTDPQIKFLWGEGSPSPQIASDIFSARRSGQVEAPATGTYRFYTCTSDGRGLRERRRA